MTRTRPLLTSCHKPVVLSEGISGKSLLSEGADTALLAAAPSARLSFTRFVCTSSYSGNSSDRVMHNQAESFGDQTPEHLVDLPGGGSEAHGRQQVVSGAFNPLRTRNLFVPQAISPHEKRRQGEIDASDTRRVRASRPSERTGGEHSNNRRCGTE